MAMGQIKFDIFPWEILKSDAIFYQRISKYFSDFQNRNFSVLWLNWTQTMEMKQNETLFHGVYSNLASFLIGRKNLKYFNGFYNWYLSISLQNWAQTSKMKNIVRNMCKSDSILPNLECIVVFEWFLIFISWKGLSQKWIITFCNSILF